MQEKIIGWGNILAIEMNHWVIFTAVMSLWVLMGGTKPPVFLWGIWSLVPIALFLVRRYTSKGWILWGSHLACALLCILGIRFVGKLAEYMEGAPNAGVSSGLTGIAAQVMSVLYIAFCVIYSLYLRLNSDSQIETGISPVPAIGIIFVSLLVTRYQGRLDWDDWYIALTVGYFCSYFLLYYIRNYLKLVSFNSICVENLPAKNIFRTGIRFIAIYLSVIVTAFLLLINSDWISAIMQSIKQWLTGKPIPQISAKELRRERLLFRRRRQKSWLEAFGKAQLEENEIWREWKPSDKLLLSVLSIMIAILLVYAAVQIGKIIRKKFYLYRRSQIKEKKYSQEEDFREKCTIVKEKKERKSIYPFLNPAEKIRYICKRYVEGQYQMSRDRGKLLKYHTIREWSEGAGKKELADLYEKARYSKEQCTKADVKQLKKFLQEKYQNDSHRSAGGGDITA